MSAKTWNVFVITGMFVLLGMLGVFTAVIDPFFHYHKPLSGMEYPMKDERYQNDGIARWFEYDAMITGTSMTQNFKVSELNALMGVNAVKTSYSGASFHELSQNMERALGYNPDLKLIVCSMDGSRILYPADKDEYTGYPEYLYDKNPFNDVNYLLNKDVVPKTIAVINYTRAGEKTPSMDMYGSWYQYKMFGKEAVEASMTPLPEIEETVVYSEEDVQMSYENVEKNLLALVKRYPDTEFYFFFPPYSEVYWGALVETKQLDAQIGLEKMAVEIMLQAENAHVFGFSDWYDVTGDLDNYTDTMHYSAEINSKILKAIADGDGELTKDNYVQYYDDIRERYETLGEGL